jgi:hypothetical protein
LSKKDLQQARAELREWQTPARVIELFERYASQAGENLMVQSGTNELLEAFVLGHAGRLRNASSIRIGARERPDGELCIDGTVIAVEVTEADEPGRQRGDEYREVLRRRANNEPDEIEFEPAHATSRHRRLFQLLIALRKAIRRKEPIAQLSSYGDCELLIYLKMDGGYVDPEHLDPAIRQREACLPSGFRAVWVLWNAPFRGGLTLLGPYGRTRPR